MLMFSLQEVSDAYVMFHSEHPEGIAKDDYVNSTKVKILRYRGHRIYLLSARNMFSMKLCSGSLMRTRVGR